MGVEEHRQKNFMEVKHAMKKRKPSDEMGLSERDPLRLGMVVEGGGQGGTRPGFLDKKGPNGIWNDMLVLTL